MKIMVIAAILVQVLLVAGIGYLAYSFVSEVNEYGLKSIVNEVWEGPSK